MDGTWAQRAGAAEQAVLRRHLRPVWGMPGTALGVVAWPPRPQERAFGLWDYWWQAHLLDCLVDAQVRAPDAARRRRVAAVVRGVRLRNLGAWTNRYYDDMAWLAVALERAGRAAGVRRDRAVAVLAAQLERGWSNAAGGGIAWRRGDDYRNAPSNGPAALLLARRGNLASAQRVADWVEATLRDPATGLVLDGVRPGGQVERVVWTYCQGVVLGAEAELAVRTGEPRHAERMERLIAAVATHLSADGVLQGAGGHDEGLFAGILARYLALVAVLLPGTAAAQEARRLVLASADAAWQHRREMDGLPLFGPDWRVSAGPPGPGTPERDLTVQMSGWMLLEAAAALAR